MPFACQNDIREYLFLVLIKKDPHPCPRNQSPTTVFKFLKDLPQSPLVITSQNKTKKNLLLYLINVSFDQNVYFTLFLSYRTHEITTRQINDSKLVSECFFFYFFAQRTRIQDVS